MVDDISLPTLGLHTKCSPLVSYIDYSKELQAQLIGGPHMLRKLSSCLL